jgi:hypothetical protein
LDCGPERTRRSTFGVDVDVLPVTREIGERVDIALKRFHPIADTEHRANPILQTGKTFDDQRSTRVTWCGFDGH